MELAAADLTKFQRDGWLVLPRVISNTEVAAIDRAVDAAAPDFITSKQLTGALYSREAKTSYPTRPYLPVLHSMSVFDQCWGSYLVRRLPCSRRRSTTSTRAAGDLPHIKTLLHTDSPTTTYQ